MSKERDQLYSMAGENFVPFYPKLIKKLLSWHNKFLNDESD